MLIRNSTASHRRAASLSARSQRSPAAMPRSGSRSRDRSFQPSPTSQSRSAMAGAIPPDVHYTSTSCVFRILRQTVQLKAYSRLVSTSRIKRRRINHRGSDAHRESNRRFARFACCHTQQHRLVQVPPVIAPDPVSPCKASWANRRCLLHAVVRSPNPACAFLLPPAPASRSCPFRDTSLSPW